MLFFQKLVRKVCQIHEQLTYIFVQWSQWLLLFTVTPDSSIVNWKENFSGKQKMKWKSNASKRNQVLPRKQVNQEEAIRKVKDSATTDPKSYVDTILDIHRKGN